MIIVSNYPCFQLGYHPCFEFGSCRQLLFLTLGSCRSYSSVLYNTFTHKIPKLCLSQVCLLRLNVLWANINILVKFVINKDQCFHPLIYDTESRVYYNIFKELFIANLLFYIIICFPNTRLHLHTDTVIIK